MTTKGPARVLFINAGILGLTAYHRYLEAMLPRQSRLQGELVLLPQHLSRFDRALRGALTVRLWRDGWLGIANLDLARFRAEVNTGLHARRRIALANPNRFDALFFHRQSSAWGSIDLMTRIPSIVSIDATQDAVLAASTSRIERKTYGLNARVDGAVFRAAAAIVSTSQWAANCVRTRYPGVTTPVHVVPPPVLLDHFDAAWMDERRARAAANVKPRVLFIGGDFPRKGGVELLELWEAADFAARASLDVMTDWPIRRVPNGVRVLGGVVPFSEPWRRCWREADVFAMPTRHEAFGLVYQEAAAAGLPALGSRINAVPEIVEDGVTGLLVPPRDRAALGRALDRLINDAPLRDRMGRAARARVERLAHPTRHLERITQIVEGLRGIPPAALR